MLMRIITYAKMVGVQSEENTCNLTQKAKESSIIWLLNLTSFSKQLESLMGYLTERKIK